MMPREKIYLGLGANLGDRQATLRAARELLGATAGIALTASSPLYETAPVGGPANQGLYLNAVLELVAALDPEELLQLCLTVEGHFGRQRSERWGARTLDIDLLAYGERVIETATLCVPHPRLAQRGFVLAPLCDLAPDWRHPVSGQTVRQLWQALQPAPGVRRFSETW